MKKVHAIHNKLLKRNEVIYELTSESSPATVDVAKKLAEEFKVTEEHVVVKRISNKYGTRLFEIDAVIYDSPDAKAYTEVKKKEKKVAA